MNTNLSSEVMFLVQDPPQSAHSLLPFLHRDKKLEAIYPSHAFPKWIFFVALKLHQNFAPTEKTLVKAGEALAVLLSGQIKVSDHLTWYVGALTLTWEDCSIHLNMGFRGCEGV